MSYILYLFGEEMSVNLIINILDLVVILIIYYMVFIIGMELSPDIEILKKEINLNKVEGDLSAAIMICGNNTLHHNSKTTYCGNTGKGNIHYREEEGNIVELTFENLSFDEFPPHLYNLKHLRRLEISRCHIKKIHADLSKLSNLEYLSIPHNELVELPDLGNLPNLKILKFYSVFGAPKYDTHRWEIIEKSISNLEYLKELQISHIHKIPSPVFYMINLEKLTFDHHTIDEIPEGIGNLINLHTLVLFGDGRRLSKLPESFTKLKKLEHLNLVGAKNLKDRDWDIIGKLLKLRLLFVTLRFSDRIPSQIYNLNKLEILKLDEFGVYDDEGSIDPYFILKPVYDNLPNLRRLFYYEEYEDEDKVLLAEYGM